jgi:hypothetical protein
MSEKRIKKYFDEKRSKFGVQIIPDKINKNKFTFIGESCHLDQVSVVKKSIKKSKYYYEVNLNINGCNIFNLHF